MALSPTTDYLPSGPPSEDTLAYLTRLDRQSSKMIALIDTLPMPAAYQAELRQAWQITRQKLSFFQREYRRADGELRSELSILHQALLPEVISYQVNMGAHMISDQCGKRHEFLHRYRAIWSNFRFD